MKAERIKTIAGVGAFSLLFAVCYGWLSFGVFSDREFGTLYLFSKHRPSPQFYFHAPVGESDTPLASLPPSQQRAETAFEEFVERNGGYSRRHRLFH